ncbi:hypothetical protein [Nocardioides sp. HB32]
MARTGPVWGSYVTPEPQADRQRELDWANTAYAHHQMDTETWIRTINEIEAKYRAHV